MTGVDEIIELERVLALQAEVERANASRARADAEIFVGMLVRLTLVAIAIDQYLQQAHVRPKASPAVRRLRWSLDQIEYRQSGDLSEIASLGELTYVVVASFLGRVADTGNQRAEVGDNEVVALRELRRALGSRGADLDVLVTHVVRYANFNANVDARRARTLWRRLADLQGDPLVHGFTLSQTGTIEVAPALLALSDPPSDDQLWQLADRERYFQLPPAGSAPGSPILHTGWLGSAPGAYYTIDREAPAYRVPAKPNPALEPRDSVQEPDGGEYRVWYGTNRAPHPSPDSAGNTYSAVFSEHLSTGVCLVRIPKAHRIGSIGLGPIPALLHVVGRDARLSVVGREVVEEPVFHARLRAAVLEDSARAMLVYIHGFNMSFDKAAMRTAQLAFDLRFRGPAAFYSWPSKGNPWSYTADMRDADASVELLADFLTSLAAKSGVERLHVIAHSMGNRILGLALESIRHRKLELRLGELVLAAPDLDRNLFNRLARVYPRLASGTTLYVSRRDQALALSGRLWAGPRVGFHPPVTVASGIDTVDVRSLDLSLLGHGYVSALSPVLTDIEAVLRGCRPPGTRMRVSASDDGRYWVLR